MNNKKLPGLITDVWLKNLKISSGKTNEYYKENGGFTVRILASGVITFLYIYNFDGKRKQMSLGRYPTTSLAFARKKHKEAQDIYSNGADPMAKPPTPPPPPKVTSVNDTAANFLDKWSATYYSARWHSNVKAALETDVLPYIGERDITAITRKDLIPILERVVKRAPGQARNVNKAMSKMFWYAKAVMECIEVSPCVDMLEVLPTLRVSKGRDRTLDDREIRKLWQRIDRFSGSDSVKRALKFILVTGQRPDEVVKMHRCEITKETTGSWWTIPWQRIKTECSKTLKREPYDHRVYLTPLALSLIGETKSFIFPSHRSDEQDKEKPILRNSLSQRVERSDTLVLKNRSVTFKYYGLKKWGPHDLRRSMKTGMAKLVIPDRHAEEVINHKQSVLTRTYDTHTYDDEKIAALTAWSKHLERILGLPSTPTER